MIPHEETPVGTGADSWPVQEFTSLEDLRKAVFPKACEASDASPPMRDPWVERLFDESYVN